MSIRDHRGVPSVRVRARAQRAHDRSVRTRHIPYQTHRNESFQVICEGSHEASNSKRAELLCAHMDLPNITSVEVPNPTSPARPARAVPHATATHTTRKGLLHTNACSAFGWSSNPLMPPRSPATLHLPRSPAVAPTLRNMPHRATSQNARIGRGTSVAEGAAASSASGVECAPARGRRRAEERRGGP